MDHDNCLGTLWDIQENVIRERENLTSQRRVNFDRARIVPSRKTVKLQSENDLICLVEELILEEQRRDEGLAGSTALNRWATDWFM
jgi:hypothetical protein